MGHPREIRGGHLDRSAAESYALRSGARQSRDCSLSQSTALEFGDLPEDVELAGRRARD
jgi:hypothetical protein